MAVLAGYLDDSGTHQGSPIVTVAGGVASVPQWIRFSRQWKKQLDRWNVEFFHMADFVSGHGKYKGWDENRKDHALSVLVKIINDNVRFLVGNAVYTGQFAKANAKYPNPCIKDAYHFCAVLALPAVGSWALRSDKREPVALIYESGNKLLDEYWRLIQKDFAREYVRQAYKIASITTGDKKDIPALQAADLIAYGTYKYRAQKTIQPYLEKAYRSLFQIESVGLIYTQENIEDCLDRICHDLEARSQKQSS